ncbi:MAG TPA: DUF4339 domain-containing protein [Vicinamibacteria bacterium]|jgi:hypothetical protein|nr:DUF4339 domain-containing protein [Vicinamibacteria bacterium]
MAEGAAASRWFYAHGGRRHGPVDVSRLVDLILAGEIPETTLIWHPGLSEWVMAGDLDEIRRELPPPLPVSAPSLSENDPATGLSSDSTDAAAELGEGSGMRRRRKHRHRNKRDKTQWLLPLLVVLLVLMIGLWLILRRMNEVPSGRIILQGSLDGSAGGLSQLPSARSGL